MSVACADQTDSRLDRLLVRYMQSVSHYLALANLLESRLASGRLGLSKTRCSAMPAAGGGIGGGSACLGRLQYCEADMSAASATVAVVQQQADGSSELRETNYEDEDEEADQFALMHNPEAGNRALRWFSALPPPSLRAARREFESALSLAVALANEKARMHRIDKKMAAIKANNSCLATSGTVTDAPDG